MSAIHSPAPTRADLQALRDAIRHVVLVHALREIAACPVHAGYRRAAQGLALLKIRNLARMALARAGVEELGFSATTDTTWPQPDDDDV